MTTFYTTNNNLNKWIVPSYYVMPIAEDMIINISIITGTNSLTLPFGGISSLNVNWGNGVSSTYITTPSYTYAVTTPAYYSIRISGYATSFGNASAIGYTGASLISSVSKWGTIGLTSLQGAFKGATNLVSVPSSITEYITNMSSMFYGATSFNQSSISLWNTSRITNMSSMFYNAASFDQYISSWNVSSVSSANNIFCGCPVFGQEDKYPKILPAPNWGC
jgi:surface protein